MNIKFYLDSAGLPDFGQIRYIGIGSDGIQICQLLYQEYRIDELAYIHHTENYSIPPDVQFVPFSATIQWQVGDITFPYFGEGMSSLLLQLKEQGGLKYNLVDIDDRYLTGLFTTMHPEAVLTGLWGEPMVSYLLRQSYTRAFRWVLRIPFRFEGYGVLSDLDRQWLSEQSNIILIDSPALVHRQQPDGMALDQAFDLVHRHVCQQMITTG
ncbi:hypothetical protein [Sphingobacterium faecale]|uniref:Uncharacterized protein n=1 Tax=Sphingobacterium faecale TaxID=2803775 RepID=A0ABS1R1Y3_9SPHI|nr:hypothetical protein [Sphingobacterium faecale]MBL1408706.1 hypothetical protein [Sphingobacterium faecale]